MKIVINDCYGGFELSPAACLWLWDKGKTSLGTPVDEYFDDAAEKEEALRQWRESKGDTDCCRSVVFSPDEQFVLDEFSDDRACPLLIQCVEALGVERAGAQGTKLKVVEIPDGVQWEIGDANGVETIHEVHRTWR